MDRATKGESIVTIFRGLAVGTVLSGAAIGFAGPAMAEPISGTYTAVVGNTSTMTQT